MFLKMKMDCKMEMEYLLDTNAYFNFLNELSNSIPSERKDEILGLNTTFYSEEKFLAKKKNKGMAKNDRGNPVRKINSF